jgi:hypothetical protein
MLALSPLMVLLTRCKRVQSLSLRCACTISNTEDPKSRRESWLQTQISVSYFHVAKSTPTRRWSIIMPFTGTLKNCIQCLVHNRCSKRTTFLSPILSITFHLLLLLPLPWTPLIKMNRLEDRGCKSGGVHSITSPFPCPAPAFLHVWCQMRLNKQVICKDFFPHK